MSPPIFNPDSPEVNEIVLPNGATASEVIDPDGNVVFEARPDIPDYADLYYPFGERSGSTLVEQVQNADGAANGLTNVAGTYIDDHAESGDGSDDYGELTTWSEINFGSNIDTDWTILFTLETSTSSQSAILGSANSTGPRLDVRTGFRGSVGNIEWEVLDANGNDVEVRTDSSAFNDGNKYRVALVKSGNSASGFSIWVNATEKSLSTESDATLSGGASFNNPVTTHSWNNAGTIERFSDATIDNPVVSMSALSSTEIQDDYDRQPWS